MKILLFALLLLVSTFAQSSCVILLHGLARTDASMSKMEHALTEHGYAVVNKDYPSRDFKIEQLAEKAIGSALERCGNNRDISFVTHSLGGILVRQYLSKHYIPKLRHVVMLGPPNKGTEVVDMLAGFPGFHFILGDAALQLSTGDHSVPNSLGPAKFDLGIIAGTKSFNPILSAMIPGNDDGTVSIKSTRLEGMNDHIEMNTSHFFMMRNEEVIKQVIYYLSNGKFNKSKSRMLSS